MVWREFLAMAHTGFIMGDTSDHALLTEQEAVTLLQPYLHNKSAIDWLENDRQGNPIIPFILLQGISYYREDDLIFFITHMLDPKARFVRVNNQLYGDHRNLSERRRNGERRKSEVIPLRKGIERRRWGDLDRRLSGGFDRRAQLLVYP